MDEALNADELYRVLLGPRKAANRAIDLLVKKGDSPDAQLDALRAFLTRRHAESKSTVAIGLTSAAILSGIASLTFALGVGAMALGVLAAVVLLAILSWVAQGQAVADSRRLTGLDAACLTRSLSSKLAKPGRRQRLRAMLGL